MKQLRVKTRNKKERSIDTHDINKFKNKHVESKRSYKKRAHKE